MEFRIVVDAPTAGLRRLTLFVALPLALLGVTAAVAHATYDTSFVAGGQSVKAIPLKTALDDIQSRLVKPMITVNGLQYSTAATYLGSTAATTGDMSGFAFGTGYAATKKACMAAFPANPSSHMCTSEELTRSAALGVVGPPTNGWFASFTLAMGQTVAPASAQLVLDCSGWTEAAAGHSGPATGSNGGTYNASNIPCNQAIPLLCCD